MSNLGIISVDDLYELSEEEVINKIKNCSDYNISECFKTWEEALDVKTSDEEISNKYCINIKAKKRYINPLVKTEKGIERISDISDKARECINNCLNYTFDRYVYMDFDFNNISKVLRKKKTD